MKEVYEDGIIYYSITYVINIDGDGNTSRECGGCHIYRYIW